MTEIVQLAGSWRILLLGIIVFGLMPGVALRVVVAVYPNGHPRREELLGELYAIPMAARPFWVAQQLETALFEGIPARWHSARERVAREVIGTLATAEGAPAEFLLSDLTHFTRSELIAYVRVVSAAKPRPSRLSVERVRNIDALLVASNIPFGRFAGWVLDPELSAYLDTGARRVELSEWSAVDR